MFSLEAEIHHYIEILEPVLRDAGQEMWQALDRIISAKNAMEGIVAKEMYIRGFLDYERLVCEKDNHIWKMKMWQHKQIRPSVKAISHRRSLLSHLHKRTSVFVLIDSAGRTGVVLLCCGISIRKSEKKGIERKLSWNWEKINFLLINKFRY